MAASGDDNSQRQQPPSPGKDTTSRQLGPAILLHPADHIPPVTAASTASRRAYRAMSVVRIRYIRNAGAMKMLIYSSWGDDWASQLAIGLADNEFLLTQTHMVDPYTPTLTCHIPDTRSIHAYVRTSALHTTNDIIGRLRELFASGGEDVSAFAVQEWTAAEVRSVRSVEAEVRKVTQHDPAAATVDIDEGLLSRSVALYRWVMAYPADAVQPRLDDPMLASGNPLLTKQSVDYFANVQLLRRVRAEAMGAPYTVGSAQRQLCGVCILPPLVCQSQRQQSAQRHHPSNGVPGNASVVATAAVASTIASAIQAPTTGTGRCAIQREICAAMRGSRNPILYLWGPSGVGKTAMVHMHFGQETVFTPDLRATFPFDGLRFQLHRCLFFDELDSNNVTGQLLLLLNRDKFTINEKYRSHVRAAWNETIVLAGHAPPEQFSRDFLRRIEAGGRVIHVSHDMFACHGCPGCGCDDGEGGDTDGTEEGDDGANAEGRTD